MPSVQRTLVYQHGQATALVAVILFAFISLFAIAGVLIRYSWDPLMKFLKKHNGAKQHHSRAVFHTQLGAYIASLMISNAFTSLSMIINVQWAADKKVTAGTLCEAQGILMQIGDTGAAYFSGAIAIHTFNSLVLRNKLPGWFCLAANVWGWLLVIFIAATPTWINNTVLGPIYGINDLSCGVASNWTILGAILHLLPILLGSLVSVAFFTLVFLVLRGTLTIKNGIKFNLNRQHRWSTSSATTIEFQRFIAAVGRSMLWYPFAFNILLLPEIVVGLIESSGSDVSFEVHVFATASAALLGLVNALILCNTLRILRPYFDGTLTVPPRSGKDADMESFFAGVKSPRPFSVTISPDSPKNPEKAFVPLISKPQWAAPTSRYGAARRASIGQTVTRNINRVSRAISLKRKPVPTSALPQVAPAPVSRPITPVAQLNAMIAVPERALRKNTLPRSPRLNGASPSLPAPRRDTRSPVVRQPTLSDSPVNEKSLTTINLNTPERKGQGQSGSDDEDPHHGSANESLLSMYLCRSPEQEEMVKPSAPSKEYRPIPKPRMQPMPLSARAPAVSSHVTVVPPPQQQRTFRSARVPVPYTPVPAPTPSRESLAEAEWAERAARVAASRRGATPTTATMKAERRKSRSLDFDVRPNVPYTPATATLRTPATATLRTPVAASLRTPASATYRPLGTATLRTPGTATLRTPGTAASFRTATYGAPLAPRRDASLPIVSARSPLSARRAPPSRAGSVTSGAYGYI